MPYQSGNRELPLLAVMSELVTPSKRPQRRFDKLSCVDSSGVSIDEVSGDEQLTEFCLFADQVNAERSAYWPAIPEMQLPLLKG